MDIEIKIDNSLLNPKIILITPNMTEEINEIINELENISPKIISGFKDSKTYILNQDEIINIYANDKKVFAVTKDGEYTIRFRLYELEKRLNKNKFVRISNSEIINLRKVKNFDLSFNGTICVKLSNANTTYVSRRYVSKIKKILGV